MDKIKKIFCYILLIILVGGATCIGFLPQNCLTTFAEGEESGKTTPEILPPYENSYSVESSARKVTVNLKVNITLGLHGDLTADLAIEENKDTLKQFQKYVKKQIDSADIGELFYATLTPTSTEDKTPISARQQYKVYLPKSYKHKDVAVIPFTDYRTTQRVISATIDKTDCSITFFGNNSAYAYAIVYNGVYKQIIWIAIIMVAVLTICILVKIYCLRKDDPYYKDKKAQKEIAKKKAKHKENRKLAQELKREKEKLNKK